MSDLTERLRADVHTACEVAPCAICLNTQEAVARIEELEAERDAAWQTGFDDGVDSMPERVHELELALVDLALKKLELAADRIDELEAALSEAVKRIPPGVPTDRGTPGNRISGADQ